MISRAFANTRLLAALLFLLPSLAARCPGGGPTPEPLAPSPGLLEYQELALVEVPGGVMNAAGGSLLVERIDLDLDTRLGNLPIGAVYDSAAGTWRWSFELHYDGGSFADASGAVFDTLGLAPGEPIEGTHWLLVDGARVATKGGLVHVFGSEGRLSAIHWRGSDYPRFVFVDEPIAGAPRVVEIRQHTAPQSSEPLYTLVRDGTGRLVRIEDRAGRSAEFGWDASGQLVVARDGLDVEQGWPGFRYEYAGGLLTAVTNSEGERVEYVHDAGRLVAARAVGAGSVGFEIEHAPPSSDGLYSTLIRDPLGGSWILRFDEDQRLHRVVDPVGATTSFGWAGRRVASRSDPAGVTTYWSWQDDDPVQEIQPSGNVVSISWDATAANRANPRQRAPLLVVDSLGVLEQRSYDANGRVASTVNGAGEITSFRWGPLGELLAMVAPTGKTTSFSAYGEHGHPAVITDGEGDHSRVYDAVGNQVAGESLAEETGPSQPGVVSRSFDADRNVASVMLAPMTFGVPTAPETLVIEHRSDGRRRRILRPHAGDSEFVYDDRGRLVERRDRSGGSWRVTRIERDLLGRATRIDRPNETWTELEWDAAGRQARIASGRGASEESSASLAWAEGRLQSISDAAYGGSEVFSYDAAGRVATVRFPGGEWLQLGWDVRSRNSEELYWHGGGLLRRLQYAYDGVGRLVEARDGGDLLVHRSFSEGRWVEVEYGNGLVRSATYSPTDDLLAETATVDADGTEVERTFLTREGLTGLIPGLRWSAVTTTSGGVAATSEESHLLMPPRGSASDAGPRTGGFEASATLAAPDLYSYDAIGNIVGRVGANFVHNPEHNRLLRIEHADGTVLHEYAWDEAGFATERDGVALAWSAAGRIASIGDVAAFRWDALGRLVACEVAGVETRALFGGRVSATASGAPLSIERGEVRIDLVSGDHRWRHFDFRGNVKFLSDAEGNVIAHRGFDAYGTATLWGADPDALGFAQGRELAGLVLLGGRLHDPAAGRFLAPDPVYPLVNTHAYVLGNPVWLWDPDGRSARSALAIAAGVGVVGMAVGAAVAGAVAAGPAAAAAGLGIAAFSLGFTLGIFAPSTATAPAAAGGLATVLAGAGGFVAAALPLGFVVGQTVQLGILTDFGAGEPPPSGLRGGNGSNRRRGNQGGGSGSLGDFEGIMIKTLELTAEIPSVGGEAPGCSPTLGARVLPGRAWVLALLLPLQLMLGWRWLRRR